MWFLLYYILNGQCACAGVDLPEGRGVEVDSLDGRVEQQLLDWHGFEPLISEAQAHRRGQITTCSIPYQAAK